MMSIEDGKLFTFIDAKVIFPFCFANINSCFASVIHDAAKLQFVPLQCEHKVMKM